MTHLELRARIGPDGILTLNVPIGMSEANREVKVVVETAETDAGDSAPQTRAEWSKFVEETAGAWLGDLDRPPQGVLEVRDELP